MLAKVATILSFVIFVSLFGWQVRVASMQPYNQAAASYRKQYSAQKIEPGSADERLATYTEWLAAFTGLLAVVSAVQGIFLYRADKTARISANAAKTSADAAKQTVRTMENTAERQLRAYVYVADASILEANSGYQPNIRIKYKNYGQTPAYEVRNTGKFTTVLTGKPDHMIREATSHHSDLGPSQDKSTTMLVPLSAWAITKPIILNRAGIGVVFGEITYFDAFQDRASAAPHFTRYRFEIPVDEDGITDGVLLFSEEGNESN